MQSFTRHLVSQHLGKVVATVIVDDLDAGTVRLAAESPVQLSVQFGFVPNTVQQVFSDPDLWPEMVTRLAVSQAHKLHAGNPEFVGELHEPLNLELHPWIGDLLPASNGGAH